MRYGTRFMPELGTVYVHACGSIERAMHSLVELTGPGIEEDSGVHED